MESLKQYWYEFVAAQGIESRENARRAAPHPLSHESSHAPAHRCRRCRDAQLLTFRASSVGKARHHGGRLSPVRARVRTRVSRRTDRRSCTSSRGSIGRRTAGFRRSGLRRPTARARHVSFSTKVGRRARLAGRRTARRSRSSRRTPRATRGPPVGADLRPARNSGSSRRRPARRGASRRWPTAYRTACGRRTVRDRFACRARARAMRGPPEKSEATCGTTRKAHTSSMTTDGSTTDARTCGPSR